MAFSPDLLNLFSTAVDRAFGDLAQSGFQLENISTRSDELIGDIVEVRFKNRPLGRALRFNYSRSFDGEREALTIFLENGSGESVLFKNLLKFLKAPASSIERVSLDRASGSLEQRFDAVLIAARSAVLEHAREILDGSRWV